MYEILESQLARIKQSGEYRIFTDINRIGGNYPRALSNGKPVTAWCSNDYLGMSQNDLVMASAVDAIQQHGVGSGGSRNIGGTHQYLTELEVSIAEWHQKEAALVYPTGYSSNDATLQCLLRMFPELIIFSDEKNHASIINGIRSSKNQKHIFRHNDADHLESLLKTVDTDCPKLIIFESVYSMDGDIADISGIVTLAKKYRCLTYLDQVHAIGMYGARGAGIAEALGHESDIDIIQGTMAKAIGVIGGYVAGNRTIIDFIRSFSSGFIFTTSLPPSIAKACLTSINHLKASDSERQKLKFNTALLRAIFAELGIPIMGCSETHILPVKIGDARKCKQAADLLLSKHGIYIQSINSPTVEVGTERFRINATPNHTETHIRHLAEAIKSVFVELEIDQTVALG